MLRGSGKNEYPCVAYTILHDKPGLFHGRCNVSRHILAAFTKNSRYLTVLAKELPEACHIVYSECQKQHSRHHARNGQSAKHHFPSAPHNFPYRSQTMARKRSPCPPGSTKFFSSRANRAYCRPYLSSLQTISCIAFRIP